MENKNNEISKILKYKIENSLKTIGLSYLDVVDYTEYIEIISPKFRFYMNKEGYQRMMKEALKKEIENHVKNTRDT